MSITSHDYYTVGLQLIIDTPNGSVAVNLVFMCIIKCKRARYTLQKAGKNKMTEQNVSSYSTAK